MRLRTIDGALQEIKAADPSTALTAWALRQLVKNGEIPVMTVGSKSLISVETVENYIHQQTTRGDSQ